MALSHTSSRNDSTLGVEKMSSIVGVVSGPREANISALIFSWVEGKWAAQRKTHSNWLLVVSAPEVRGKNTVSGLTHKY